MQNTLLTTGIACLIAAIVGGGLKAFSIEIPLLSSLFRQLALGALGFILLSLSFLGGLGETPQSTPATTRKLPSSIPPTYPVPVATESARTQGSRQSVPISEFFQNYYAVTDEELKELIILLIREDLTPLAISYGYSADYIDKAEISELERIAEELQVLQ